MERCYGEETGSAIMKQLDWYIIKKFLGTFFLSISLLILIVIVFDVSENIDDFIEHNAPLNQIIFVYYLNFIPYFINLFSALFTFVAVIYFTSRMAANTEIIAYLSSGISFQRMMVPYMTSAVFLAIMSFMLSGFIIPPANEKRVEFEETYMRSQHRRRANEVHIQVSKGVFVYVQNYSEKSGVGHNFSIELIDKSGLREKLTSDVIKWDSTAQSWGLINYYHRTINGMNETVDRGFRIDTVFANLCPEDFFDEVTNVATLNYFELDKHIEKQRLKGSEDVKYFEVEKQKRFASPFATIVLTIIGVSVACRKSRGGTGAHLGIGLGLSFAYILFMQVSTTFSLFGNLYPWVAVWIPNFLFLIISIVLYRMAPK